MGVCVLVAGGSLNLCCCGILCVCVCVVLPKGQLRSTGFEVVMRAPRREKQNRATSSSSRHIHTLSHICTHATQQRPLKTLGAV